MKDLGRKVVEIEEHGQLAGHAHCLFARTKQLLAAYSLWK